MATLEVFGSTRGMGRGTERQKSERVVPAVRSLCKKWVVFSMRDFRILG